MIGGMGTQVVEVLRGVFGGDASGMVKASGTAVSAASGAESKVKKSLASVGASWTKTGAVITGIGAGITGTVAGVGLALGTMAADFESEMGKTRTLLAGISDTEFKKYEDGVLRISRLTGENASELGGSSLYQTISVGAKGLNEQMFVLEQAAKAGAAGIGETNDAVALGKAVVDSYGISWSKVNEIYDKAQTTINLGSTTMGEMGTAIGRVAKQASTQGVALNELFGAYATLTGVTGNTNEVTTALRGTLTVLTDIYRRLPDDLRKLAEARRKAVKDGDQKAIDAIDEEIRKLTALQQAISPTGMRATGLAGAMKALGNATDLSADKLRGLGVTGESLTTILYLAGQGNDVLRQKTEAMTKSNGAMMAAYEERTKTFAFQWKTFMADLSALGIELGRELLPTFKEIIGGVREWMEANRELVKTRFKEFVENLADAAQKAWPTIQKLGSAVGGIVEWLLKHPMAADIAAIAVALGPLALAIGPVVMAGGQLLTVLSGTGGLVGAFTTLGPLIAAVGVAYAGWKIGNKLDDILKLDDRIKSLLDRFTALRAFFESAHSTQGGRMMMTIAGGAVTGPLGYIAGQTAQNMTGAEQQSAADAAIVEANRRRREAKYGVAGDAFAPSPVGGGGTAAGARGGPAGGTMTDARTSTVNVNVQTPGDAESLAHKVARRLEKFSRSSWGL